LFAAIEQRENTARLNRSAKSRCSPSKWAASVDSSSAASRFVVLTSGGLAGDDRRSDGLFPPPASTGKSRREEDCEARLLNVWVPRRSTETSKSLPAVRRVPLPDAVVQKRCHVKVGNTDHIFSSLFIYIPSFRRHRQ
jgi:hypothetical protein